MKSQNLGQLFNPQTLGCFLLTAALLAIVFVLGGECFRRREISVHRRAIRYQYHIYIYIYIHQLTHFRQCVKEVFCSTSTERSKKSSSLLRTVSQHRHFVSLTKVPWNISRIHVGPGGSPSAFCSAVSIKSRDDCAHYLATVLTSQ